MLDIWPKGRLVELTEDECWTELTDHRVGRLVWCSGERPHVVPVNFATDDGSVWVRTTPYSRLAQEAADSWVAFEVDEVDEYNHAGLSVVVEGRCQRAVNGPDGSDVETWADGSRTLYLRISADTVTGRRLMPS
jgi:nitroimidazol reductase NimA-like FMN-containing flavoprotein (pyridoxamine 5'-phosphate oxidase superfamily)